MSQPIKLYYWPTPNGWKISIALEEMGLPYEVSLVNINKGDQYSTEFAAVAPNNKMPAIYDPDGPGGEPISIFESGAILQYLARKTGRFYGSSEREQIAVDEWLMWQMGGVGPMAGQSHHFMKYAPMMDPPQVLPYAQDRYKREVGRLYKVLDKRLSEHEWVAGDFYSIADMAIWPWAQGWDKIGQAQTMDDKPHMQRWLDACWDRPAVRKGRELRNDLRDETGKTEESQAILFKHGA
ncbi:MAG: glutathione S-transferase N-terminal domain-containing protein [Pseudomonadota bacterium]